MLASNGLTTPPWGVPQVLLLPPLTRRVPSLSRSSTGAFSHSLISHSTCRSTMRRATDLRRSECGIVSKELIKDYPSPRLLRFGEDFASTTSLGGTRSRSHGGIATGRRSTLARRASRWQPHPRSGTMDELEAQRNRLHARLGR